MEEKKVKIHGSVWAVFSNWVRSHFIFSRPNNSKTFGIILARNSSLAFTLIEVLVVVALIGVLSGSFIVIVNPKVQLEKTRDSQRRSHLRQIQSALEVYRADCGEYPTPASGNKLNSPLTASCNSPSVVTYMQSVPVDPKTGNAYYYCTDSCPIGAPVTQYKIFACLENDKDTASDGSGQPCPGTQKFIRYNNP